MIRNNSIYISDETNWMLKMLAKSKASKDGNGIMTNDELGDCLLREKLTTEYPGLVTIWENLERTRQEARKNYVAIESDAIKAIT